MNRSLRSAGFQPAVSSTFSRPGVGLLERVQVAGPVGYARRLRVENPRYGRLESLRYRVHGPDASPMFEIEAPHDPQSRAGVWTALQPELVGPDVSQSAIDP